MNALLSALGPHPSKRISDAVRCDPAVIDLTVGVPDYGPPPRFAAELTALLADQPGGRGGEIHTYADSHGHRDLRQAIADRYHRRYGLEIDADSQILVTHGGAEAIWLAVSSLTNPGDAVAIPDPGYMLYSLVVQSLGRTPVLIRTATAGGLLMDPDAIAQAAREGAKLLLFSSPDNPTGAVYPRPALEAIADLAQRFGFYVMHDEVFDDLTYGHRHWPLAAMTDGHWDQVVLVNSVSKRYGMTG